MYPNKNNMLMETAESTLNFDKMCNMTPNLLYVLT
jgi:hypothetical protein